MALATCRHCSAPDPATGDRVWVGAVGPFCDADCRDSFLGELCPECGARGRHEDNGLHGLARAYCCKDCGAHFDAVLS